MSKWTVNILLSWLGTKDIDNMLDGEKNASSFLALLLCLNWHMRCLGVEVWW